MPPTAYKSSNCLGWHPGPSLPPSLIHHSSVSYTLSVSPSESFENPYTAMGFPPLGLGNGLPPPEMPSPISPHSLRLTYSLSHSSNATDLAKPALLFPMCKSSQMSRISLAALHLPLLKLCNLLSLFFNHLCISDSFD